MAAPRLQGQRDQQGHSSAQAQASWSVWNMNPAKSFAAIGITTDKAREAERLVAMCREDAIRAGISEQDLEDAVGGDLVSNMLEALDAAAVRAIEEATSGGILNDEAAN